MVQRIQLGRIKKWHHEAPNHPRGELGVTMNCCRIRTNRLITVHQRSCWKVMFSQVSVCHSVQREGVHVTITYDAFDLTEQSPMFSTLVLCTGPHPY